MAPLDARGSTAAPAAAADLPEWHGDVFQLAQTMARAKHGDGLFPWLKRRAKKRARKAFKDMMDAGRKAALAGEGQPVPRQEPLVLGKSPVVGSVAVPGSIVATDEGGFLVSRAHGGLKAKRKMCMRCRIVYDGAKAVQAAAVTAKKQLAAALVKGSALQAANADAVAGRLAMARASNDGFYGINPRSDKRRMKDAALRKCLALPEGPDRSACLERVNGRRPLVEDPHSVVEPGLIRMPPAEDSRGAMSDASKPFSPGDSDTTSPATDTSGPYGALLQARASAAASGGEAGGPVGVTAEMFEEMVREEPEEAAADSEVAGGKFDPAAALAMMAGDPDAPSKDALMAAVAQAGPALANKRFSVIGPMPGLPASDFVDARPGGGQSVSVIETEVCLNEGSRAFVYSVWRGMFAAQFDGAEVACDDADP